MYIEKTKQWVAFSCLYGLTILCNLWIDYSYYALWIDYLICIHVYKVYLAISLVTSIRIHVWDLICVIENCPMSCVKVPPAGKVTFISNVQTTPERRVSEKSVIPHKVYRHLLQVWTTDTLANFSICSLKCFCTVNSDMNSA